MTSKGYWEDKKVLITGVNGFIGGNLAKNLLKKGAIVTGLIRNNDKNTLIHYENLVDRMVLIKGDLTDKELIMRIGSEEQINVVYHLAAQVEVGIALENPYLTFETNIRGTYTLLEAIRVQYNKIEAVIIASSDKAYGSYPQDKMPYKEDYPLIPTFPYDTSKACADMIAQVYANVIYQLPIVITRFCNIYGPGQMNYSALIPDAIRSAIQNKQFIPRGDGSMIRDFIYSEDVADLYTRIAECIALDPAKYRGEVYNAGTNTPKSVKAILTQIYTLLDKNNELKRIEQLMRKKISKGEINCQFMDYEKVNKHFNWQPINSFDKGLEKTINWYKNYLSIQ